MGRTVDIECGDDGCDTSIENCHPIRIPHDDPTFKQEECLEFVRSEGVPDLDCSMGMSYLLFLTYIFFLDRCND